MAKIQILSDLLVNKIAAGEVIERPASVVKELIENSLDAGARRIEIALEQGGRKLIRVVDDGPGMDRDDLALSVRAHATSKLTREEDLFGIRTMGFRGEALASVGAVSQLRIVSRQPSVDEAYEVRVVGDRIEPLTAAAGAPGTTVEVRELFFNVPARQKFLRTPQTELGHITEQLARVALVYPGVEFRLTHNDRLVHHLRPAQGMQSRIADFYGRELADGLIEVARDERGLRIVGHVGRPADSRSSAKWQYLFLNGRYIRDRFIAHAIREAYRGLIEPSRSPVIFLALEIDPAAVDVNVHPTKIEVRWRDSNTVYSQVLSVLRDRFLNTDLTPALETPDAEAAPGPAQADAADEEAASEAGTGLPESRQREIRQSIADFFKRARPTVGGGPPRPPGGAAWSESGPVRAYDPDADMSPPDAHELCHPTPTMPGDAQTPSQDLCGTGFQPVSSPGLEMGSRPQPPREPLECGSVIQVHRSYLVAETADGMVIIDQHALHERILFEQLCEQVARGPLESQRMLIPETIEVSPDQVELIETHADTLNQLGFELSPYGPSTLAVHAAPTLLRPERLADFVRDMLDRLAVRSGPASTELLTNDLLSMMACKAAVKAGDALSPQEIQALMARRHLVDRSSNCPHGRPTSLSLTLRELEKQFKRA